MKRTWRLFKNIVLVTLPSIVILLIALELFFRFVIPASSPLLLPPLKKETSLPSLTTKHLEFTQRENSQKCELSGK